jgi:hypothetical protein
MALVTTGNYDTENAKSTHRFCAIITFNGIADPIFCSNTFGDIGAEHKKLIKNITYESEEYEPGEPLLRRSKLSFTLVDKDEAVIDLIGGNILLNKEVTVKFGFTALNEADFVTLPTFFVKKIMALNGTIDHNFVCEETNDFDPLYKDTVYRITDKTYLTADETAVDAVINVVSTTAAGFIATAPVPDGLMAAAIIIDNEIIAYTGTTATTFTGCSRGYLGTTAQIHSQGAIVKPCYIFNESFTQAFMRILTSGAAGTNGRYDNGVANLGPRQQFSSSLIDIEQMEREGWRYHAAYEPGGAAANICDEEFHYVIFKETKIKTIINDLFKPFHASLYKNSDGELSVRVMDLPVILEEVSADTLDDNNSKLNSMEFLDNLLMTDAVYRHDFDWAANIFLRTQNDSDLTKNDESDTAYGTYPKKEIENKALDYSAANCSRFYHTYERFVLFYGNMLTKLNVTPLFREWLFEALDDIQMDSAFWPNYRDSNRTWLNEECTVMKKTVQFNSPDLYSVNYDILNYLLIKKASSLFTLDTYDGNDAGFDTTDTDVAFNATNDVVLQGDDGHGSWAVSEAGINYIYAKLLIIIPAGADSEENIGVCVRGQSEALGVYTDELRNSTIVKYNASWDRTITVWCPAIRINNTNNILRMKVDWYSQSAGVGDRPTSITIDKWYVLKETWWTA